MRLFIFFLLALSTALAGERPRLVVLVSVDQLSAELVARWGAGLPGGLGRLLRKRLDAKHRICVFFHR